MKYLKRKLITFVVDHLFNGVTDDDCLKVAGNKIYHKGRLLSQGEKKELVSGASTILQMKAFSVVIDELTNAANKKIFKNGQTMDDIVFGRAMLYNIEIIV